MTVLRFCMVKTNTVMAAADARDNTAGQPQNHACCDPHATRVAAAWLTHSETGIRIPVVPGENIGRNHPHFGARLERFDTISRTHCRIDHTSTGFSVTDTGSRNGTWINGTRLQTNQPAPLANGDRLLLADHEFLFEGA